MSSDTVTAEEQLAGIKVAQDLRCSREFTFKQLCCADFTEATKYIEVGGEGPYYGARHITLASDSAQQTGAYSLINDAAGLASDTQTLRLCTTQYATASIAASGGEGPVMVGGQQCLNEEFLPQDLANGELLLDKRILFLEKQGLPGTSIPVCHKQFPQGETCPPESARMKNGKTGFNSASAATLKRIGQPLPGQVLVRIEDELDALPENQPLSPAEENSTLGLIREHRSQVKTLRGLASMEPAAVADLLDGDLDVALSGKVLRLKVENVTGGEQLDIQGSVEGQEAELTLSKTAAKLVGAGETEALSPEDVVLSTIGAGKFNEDNMFGEGEYSEGGDYYYYGDMCGIEGYYFECEDPACGEPMYYFPCACGQQYRDDPASCPEPMAAPHAPMAAPPAPMAAPHAPMAAPPAAMPAPPAPMAAPPAAMPPTTPTPTTTAAPVCADPYFINPSPGGCPPAKKMSERECQSLDQLDVQGMPVTYASAGDWPNPETCGCYFDQDGSVYFNRREGDACDSKDANEVAICCARGDPIPVSAPPPAPPPPAQCADPYIVNPSPGGCPAGKKLTEMECVGLDGMDVGGRGVRYSSAGDWPNPETCGCYFDQDGTVYYNSREGACTTKDEGEAVICCARGDPIPVSADDGAAAEPSPELIGPGELKTKRDDKCMDYNYNNQNVYMHPCHNGANQIFYINEDNGEMKTQYNDMCLDYNYNNGNVYMHPCHGGANQQWYIDPGNANRLRTRYNDHCLDYDVGKSNVIMWHDCHGNTNQQWFFNAIPLARKGPGLLKTHHDAKCLDYNYNNNNVYMHPCHNGANQIFSIASNGEMKTNYDDKCLDYNYGNNNVYMHPCHGGKNQRFSIKPDGHMQTAWDNKCLDYNYNNGNVYMHPCHGGGNQKWFFEAPR